jgi:Flp pilus assembly protein TadG
MVRRLARGAGLLRRFRRDRTGVSAIEFALILPIMMLLFCGTVDVTDAVTLNRKVTRTTDTLGDLVSQTTSLTNSEMKNVLDISTSIMSPYTTTPLKLLVTGVSIDSKGKATVTWSDARNRTALTKGATVTLPSQVTVPNTFLIVTEVTYDYKPTIGYVMTGTYVLKDTSYLRPRSGTTVTRTTS